jgi:2-oxoglutarate ferredoxin oxidoreductase subunit alpha
MNPQTALEDLAGLQPGALVILDAGLKLDTLRTDLTIHRVPFGEIVAATCPDAKLRKLVANFVYVGILAHLLDLDPARVDSALARVFKGKPRAIRLNREVALAGREWAREHLPADSGYRVAPMQATRGKLLIDGNAAAAIGCLLAGVSFVSWYPITPSTSLCESLIDLLEKHRVGADGKASFAAIQAEDELAALGMAVGAGWAGARAMTSSSGPGLSLMAEFAGLAYYAEVPVVIFDVQRAGPSTGLPTRTQQGDLLSAAFLSHGDTRHIVLLPGTPEEAFSLAYEAFDLAERYQTPVFVLSDLDLGMNEWVAEPFPYLDRPFDRGKVLSAADLDRLGEFRRYADPDGDGIAPRTLPGTDHPLAAYFARGSGRDADARYSERPEDYAGQLDRLARKLAGARLPAALVDGEGATALLTYGSSAAVVEEVRAKLGRPLSHLRVRAYPFGDEVAAFLRSHATVHVVDQNRDGQLRALLQMAFPGHDLRSIRSYDGLPLTAAAVLEQLDG